MPVPTLLKGTPDWVTDITDATLEGVSQSVMDKYKHLTPVNTVPGQFGHDLLARLKVKDVKLRKREEDGKLHGRVVFTVPMTLDMANVTGSLHGGCSAFLVDVCSTMAIWIVSLALQEAGNHGGLTTNNVSQSINMLYHGGTQLGTMLEIVNTTTSWGKRIVTARTEIWDATNHRLISSGTHVKMDPGAAAKL